MRRLPSTSLIRAALLPAVALAAALLPAGLRAQAGPQPGTPVFASTPAEHVILVTIDGMRPEFYLDERWPAPNLQKLAAEGSRAEAVRGVVPTVTYPSHITLVTGVLPARHGILYNRPFEPEGISGAWYMESSLIRVPTLWDVVGRAGGTSAGISWPVSAGAPIDWNIPEFWSVPGREGGLTGPPASTVALRGRVTPAGLLEEIERESLGAFPDHYWGRNLAREVVSGAMAAHIIERYRPNLLLVHLNQTDYLQHAMGREDAEVRRAVAAVDGAIGRMIDALERAGIAERTAIIVTGDHGFATVDTRVAPNVWLVEAGLLEDQRDRGNWRAAFHSGGGSVFLRLRNPADVAAVAEVRAALERLPADVRALFRIVEGEEIRARGGDPDSPLALDGIPGINFVLETSGEPVAPSRGGAHGYFPDFPQIHTGLVVWGAGVEPGRSIPLLPMEDVAPLAAALLGLTFPDPDGSVPAAFLRAPSR
jgi:hypothetical protein